MEENVSPYATTTYQYLSSNRIRVTNPRGKQTTTTYFALGAPDSSLPTLIQQPEGVTTTITRNDFGEMTQVTQAGGTVSVSRTYRYDSRHNMCRQIDPETGSTAYSYDNAGRLSWYALAASGSTGGCNLSSVPSSQRIAHAYNTLNQLTFVNYPDASPDVTYTYDDNGNLATLNSSSANRSYGYDKVNNLNSETLATGGQTFTVGYTYDTRDRLTKITYPTGLQVPITPNAYGAAKSVGGYASAIGYHENGSIEILTYGNGRVYTTTHNARTLPAELKVMDGSSTIARLTHSYDANGNITFIDDAVHGASYDRSMGYDDLDRLESASGYWGSGSYSYDALGNIKTKTEGGQAMTYNYNYTVHRLTSISGANAQSFSYDAYGNVTGNGSHGFTYNRAGNLTSSTSPSIAYKYDGHKRRVQQTEGGQTEYTMYSQSGILLHKKVGGVTTDYIYAGQMLVAKNSSSGGLHYLHTDLLGSPIKGKVGSTSFTEHYRPWGEKKIDPIQLADDITYTGHQSDTATGLTYMQARYFDPVVGRFMAVDPVGFFFESAMSFNRYVYVNNNPYKYIDPHGLAAQEPPEIEVATVSEEITTEMTITSTESEDGEVIEEVTVTVRKPKQDSTSRRIQMLKLQDAYLQANAFLGAGIMQSQQDQQLAADYLTVVFAAATGGAAGTRFALQAPRIQVVSPGTCAALLMSCVAPSVSADGTIKIGGKATMRVVQDVVRREERKELARALQSEIGKIVVLNRSGLSGGFLS